MPKSNAGSVVLPLRAAAIRVLQFQKRRQILQVSRFHSYKVDIVAAKLPSSRFHSHKVNIVAAKLPVSRFHSYKVDIVAAKLPVSRFHAYKVDIVAAKLPVSRFHSCKRKVVTPLLILQLQVCTVTKYCSKLWPQ